MAWPNGACGLTAARRSPQNNSAAKAGELEVLCALKTGSLETGVFGYVIPSWLENGPLWWTSN
jgi:hypothetical protein